MRGRYLKSILALSMAALVLVALAGCSLLGWTSSTPGSIVGTWDLTHGTDSFTMTLTAGLAFTQSGVVDSNPFTSTGTYTNDTSTITFTTLGPIYIADYSLSPNGNSMILIYQSGALMDIPIPVARQ